MSQKEEQIKNDILKGLEAKEPEASPLKELFGDEEVPVLGEEFTAKVMQDIKAQKKPSPIVRISRIALPLTACAAALIVCVSLGIKYYGEDFGLDVVMAESDRGTAYYDYSAGANDDAFKVDAGDVYGEPEAPAEEPQEEGVEEKERADADDADLPAAETTEEAEEVSVETDCTSGSVSSGTDAEQNGTLTAPIDEYDGYYEVSLFAVNNAMALANVETFTAAQDVEYDAAQAEIVLVISSNYAEYNFFGTEYTEEETGDRYELISVTSEVDKETFVNDLEEYILCLTSEMNDSFRNEDWSITLKYVSALPDALEPETLIKIVKEQESE